MTRKPALLILCLVLGGIAQNGRSEGAADSAAGAAGDSKPAESRAGIDLFYGMGAPVMQMPSRSTLPNPPPAGTYEDDEPVTGTYQGGSTAHTRMIASILLPSSPQIFEVGIGIDSIEIGGAGAKMKKVGGTTGEFALESLVFHGGVSRHLGNWFLVRGAISYDQALYGTLRSRYVLRRGADGTEHFAVIEDQVKSGQKLTFSCQYLINAAKAFYLGPVFDVFYGALKFKQRSDVAALHGMTYGWMFLFQI